MGEPNLYIKQVMVGPMMNYAYIIGDCASKEAAVIDPGWEADRLLDAAEKGGFRVTAILLTHTHFDHANETGSAAGKTGAKVYVHESESGIASGLRNVVAVKEGDKFNVGALEISVMHTPGHTAGSVCYIIDNAIFSGDTLFVGGIGRTDLDGGDPEQMFKSLMRLRELPDSMIVYPGHHYGPTPTSSIGDEKKINPYLRCRSVSDFLRIA